MSQTKHLFRIAALCACLHIPLVAHADDLQDAGKLFKQGQHAQALEKVDAILAGKPKDAQARFLKGLILTEQGDSAGAIVIFTGLTKDYPELPEPHNNLAVLYASQGQYEKAKVALEKAIRTHPSYATAHENLGDIYAKMASQAYDRALQLDKSNTATQTKLALVSELFDSRNTPAVAQAAARTPVVAPVAAAVPAAPVTPPKAAPVAAAQPAATAPAADPVTEALNATQEWAAAWSAQNSKKYLSFYSAAFATPNGESRSDWEALRRERIAAPKSIQVEVRNPAAKPLEDGRVSVSFVQTYRANHFKGTSRKTLEWVRENGRWLIAEERVGK